MLAACGDQLQQTLKSKGFECLLPGPETDAMWLLPSGNPLQPCKPSLIDPVLGPDLEHRCCGTQ